MFIKAFKDMKIVKSYSYFNFKKLSQSYCRYRVACPSTGYYASRWIFSSRLLLMNKILKTSDFQIPCDGFQLINFKYFIY